jgi:mono/diheme cytochrome c family protein
LLRERFFERSGVGSMLRWILVVVVLAAGLAAPAAAESLGKLSPAERGYHLLTEKPYLPPDFDQETFDAVWRQWPEPLRSKAEQASLHERREMAFARYGLTPRPDDPSKPLQYVVDREGNWTMNCFACHGGTVPSGEATTRVWPGAPNTRFALQTLTEEIRLAKLELQKPLSRMDLGSVVVPLGTTNGTTNAVMFGVLLMGYRDANLVLHRDRLLPKMTHHDMDAPAWWHFKRKSMIYIDGFAAKGHRGLMQFMLVPQNGPEKFREWDEEFRDVMAYLSSVEAPRYPLPIDTELASRGRVVFNRACAECHGTYGTDGTYLERRVPIEEVGTDRVRLDALSPGHRDAYGQSWFTHFGKLPNIKEPGGYVAPPLDGIWASGPYLHNGSVPTLWHVLHPDERPVVWRRAGDGFDWQRVGPQIDTFAELPAEASASWQRREYFDTRAFGKSAAGHDFPKSLNEEERRALLEYLKSI